MSTTGPPGPDNSIVTPYLVSCGILAVIALTLCTIRVYTRLRPNPRLGWDDYLIVIAEALSLSSYLTSVAAAVYGWGRHTYYVPLDDRVKAAKCLFVVQVLYIVAIATSRISVACSLLRFSSSMLWKIVLFTIIGLHTIISGGWMVVQFANCRPLRAFWEPVTDVTCWDRKYTIIYGWVSASIFVAMDLTLALLPLHLLWKLRRPIRERILIGILMAMGLLATIIAGVKMTTFNDVNLGDYLRATVKSSLIAKLEEIVIIIAACMPCLKNPAERVLKRLGVLTSHMSMSITKPSFVKSGNNLSLHSVHKQSKTDTLDSVDGHIYPGRSTQSTTLNSHKQASLAPPSRGFASESTITVRTDDGTSDAGGAAPRQWEPV